MIIVNNNKQSTNTNYYHSRNNSLGFEVRPKPAPSLRKTQKYSAPSSLKIKEAAPPHGSSQLRYRDAAPKALPSALEPKRLWATGSFAGGPEGTRNLPYGHFGDRRV